ncbi:NADH dehydrogenase [ubiquinone] 1 beta subcomplex subunit 9 [Lingula anatina]|uniref:NADH dehydrogenase [ubiquinone] 1 beta subcomplex subunit 9 n=1 Tax=Lingula anatina TaxID=7574 RepID=A0A1S3K0L8_LINAN|nr:NADH dehydrogenase [ubiquinone] 1 beta subcomplex subunit 9 [Lingula anatina]|eukprot:XP_013416178.1 NADH dehydrogenase [ubiquinone] 1 beta subcomplex subunit 9 [Lingula anatina]
MSTFATKALTHAQEVCRLYRACMRRIIRDNHNRLDMRYKCVVLRAMFEETRNIKDQETAVNLLRKWQLYLLELDGHPERGFPAEPGGTYYNNDEHLLSPDFLLDEWAEEEKAAYPKYFAKREQLKKDVLEYWENKYGTSVKEYAK